MNKAFEKILERLDEELRKSEESYYRYLDDSNLPCMFDKSDIEEKRVDTIKEMLEIVQEVAEEYNNGWIPCSERLPEEGQEVKLQDSYGNITFGIMKTLGGLEGFQDDDWWSSANNYIAWQSLLSSNSKQKDYQSKPNGNFGYQPADNVTKAPTPPKSGSNAVKSKSNTRDCDICANHTDPEEVDNGCYMCCKGYENNFRPKE